MLPAPPSNAGPVREAHRFDEARLDAWMAEKQSELGEEEDDFWG